MAKSIKKPKTAKTKRVTKGKEKTRGSKAVDVLGYVGIGIDAINSVTNIVKTVGEERRKTEELKLEGLKIKADISDKISQRENETMKVLKEYEINLKEIEKSIVEINTQSSENLKNIDLEMQKSNQTHKERMEVLAMINKIIDVALEQYRNYSNVNEIIINGDGNVYTVNIDLLNTMNSTIEKLTSTLAEANIAGLLTTYEEE